MTFLLASFALQNNFAQITEDFSDPDLTSDPPWQSSDFSGNGMDFKVVNAILQSDGPASSSILWISTPNVVQLNTGETIWTFKAKYAFPPSGSNKIEIFLVSDRRDLSANPEGYYIRLGEGGSDDGIDLLKTGSSVPVVPDQHPSVSDGINARIKVTRDAAGTWTLAADKTGGSSFSTIGTAVDKEFLTGSFFGFMVKHSSTRGKDFYFDDIAIRHEDKTPPALIRLTARSDTHLALVFSEPVDPVTAGNVGNYRFNNAIGSPVSVEVDPSDPRQVDIFLGSPLTSGVAYKLFVSNIQDLKGNAVSTAAMEIFYFLAAPALKKDVIINEILADPDPPNDLPEVEFIELYNNSDKIFDLSGWSVSDRSSSGELGSFLLLPGAYLILGPEGAVGAFSDDVAVMTLSSWPSLNNAEDLLTLKDENGVTVDVVHYSNHWYNSSDKAGGGWSLELIDPRNLCSDKDNWAASEDMSGGTPGDENSVKNRQPDLMGPKLLEALAFTTKFISARFDEKLDPESAGTAKFSIEPNVDIHEVQLDENLKEIHLWLAGDLEEKKNYTLTVEALADCAGNLIGDNNQVSFHVISAADSADIIINEILFNPRSGGVDFVELYNRSTKYINLKGWLLSNADKEDPDGQMRQITAENIIIDPLEYKAITTNAIILKEQYPFGKDGQFLTTPALPGYANDKGTVVLFTRDSTEMDAFGYSEKYHFGLLTDEEGVSLERVSFNEPSNNAANWKSAASTVGFATPGYENSQATMAIKAVSGKVTAEPVVIIPDGSGQNDFTVISYAFAQPGFVANAKILDVYGRTIKVLSENDYLSAKGFYTWDATDDNGRKVRIGYYLIYFEVFNLEGELLTFKEKVVVGTRF